MRGLKEWLKPPRNVARTQKHERLGNCQKFHPTINMKMKIYVKLAGTMAVMGKLA